MKIICIRGANLASLYGSFELPLEAGPIAETGLFSISGPTGAGKSTLVDALCLALFGRTPRLGERGRSVMVGRPDDEASLVEANDVRSILSRGTGEGFAEVDFEGVDGRRYRARWSVNRARGRASGKLQQPRMTLAELESGGALEDGLSVVPRRVEQLVGYSFDELKRAVVLPQFEFTAFLKASADERAAILERVTGTGVYTQLSVAAHQRASAEAEALRQLEERAGAVTLLSEEERAAQVARCGVLTGEQTEARTAAELAAGTLRWHEAARGHAQGVAQAREALDAAARAHEEGAPRRAELRAVEGAQELRPLRDGAARTARELDEAVKELAGAREALEAAQGKHQSASVAQQEAAEKARAAALRLDEARPELDRARDLDAGVARAEERAGEATTALGTARAEAKRAAEACAEVARSIAVLERSRDRALDWLLEHAAQQPLAAEWPRWRACLAEHAAALSDLALEEAALEGARGALRTAEVQREEDQSRTRQLETGFATLEERARAARRRLRRRRPGGAHDSAPRPSPTGMEPWSGSWPSPSRPTLP